MTVEEWLRGHFHGIGKEIEREVVEVAAISPLTARPTPMGGLSLDAEVEINMCEADFMRSLNYALSTLYYSMSTAVTGGSRSEKRGNRQMTVGGYPLTTKDRAAFRALGDKLRKELGVAPEENTGSGGASDMTYLRTSKPARKWRF